VTEQLAEAHRRLLADRSTQFDLLPPAPPAKPPAWLRAFYDWLGDILAPVGRLLRWIGNLIPDAPFARILLGIVLVAALLWLGRLAYLHFQPRRGSFPATDESGQEEGESFPPVAAARRWLQEADEFAAQGRYGEAAHYLLLRGIEDIGRRRPQALRPSLTSRDIAANDAIPAGARALFAKISSVVEASLFGGRPVSMEQRFRRTADLDAMSDIAIGRANHGSLFRHRTLALVLSIGILAFIGMLLLGAFAPDLRSGHDGGAHALSKAATGYSALVQLAADTGRHPVVIRNERQLVSEDLLVLTPAKRADRLEDILQARSAKATLVVLPKWVVSKDPDHSGWVRRVALGAWIDLPDQLKGLKLSTVPSGGRALRIVDPALPATISFRSPRPLQVMTGPEFEPLITDDRGRVVLARVGGGPLYVLSDPDLLSNRGMKDLRQASAALALLDWLNTTDAETVGFDVTLNGFGHSRSPLRLAFEPPFLAMTLAIAATLLLAGFHALNRFGAARQRSRAIAFGKTALVDNGAAMIRKAKREVAMGAPYAATIRERAITRFGVPARLRDADLDAYLDGLDGNRRFTDLARAAERAGDRAALVEAAQALHRWEKEKSR